MSLDRVYLCRKLRRQVLLRRGPGNGDSYAVSSLLAVYPIVYWAVGRLVLSIAVADPERV